MTDAWWIDWIPLRAFVGLMVVYTLVGFVYLVLVNFEVLENRTTLKKGTETWDWIWMAVFTPLCLAIFGVAWLDVGSGTASLPLWAWPIGLVLFLFGGGLFIRAMGENPFFEKTVRIQSERDHHVIDTGPYRMVRHPGYAGMLLWLLSVPLLLTSAWALLPTALAIIALVIRTALEDRMLLEKLPGYFEYASRVRFRLIPGAW